MTSYSLLGDDASPLVYPRVAALSSRSVLPSSLTSSKDNKKASPNIQAFPEMGPQRPRVFLVRDLIDRSFVCLLTRNQKLSCLGVRDMEPGKETRCLLDSHVTHLPAIDAVYIPESRLTACLEPNGSIILYSGITKVCILLVVTTSFQICILGVIPALVTISPSSSGLHSSNLRPLSVRPSKYETDISKVKAKITELLLQMTIDGDSQPPPVISEYQLHSNLSISVSTLSNALF